MATTAQIEANRRNSAALYWTDVHRRHETCTDELLQERQPQPHLSMPGLPHEDPDRIQQRTEQYLDELQPRDATELDLVHQMARLSLAVEHAERMEIAHMADRVNQATKERLEEPTAEQRKVVRELGRKLLYIAAAEDVKVDRVPPRDDPAQIVDDLEATSVGCRWLLERWQEYRALLGRHVKWDEPVLLRFFRLEGTEVVEAAFNGPLNAIFLAWEVLVPGYSQEAWKFFRDDWPMARPDDRYWPSFREIADRPAVDRPCWSEPRLRGKAGFGDTDGTGKVSVNDSCGAIQTAFEGSGGRNSRGEGSSKVTRIRNVLASLVVCASNGLIENLAPREFSGLSKCGLPVYPFPRGTCRSPWSGRFTRGCSGVASEDDRMGRAG